MPTSLSARKRVRQNAKRRLRNRMVKSAVRTRIHRLEAALERGDVEAAREEWYYVLTGTIEITLTSDECFVLEEGDAIHFESSRLHEVANPTKKTATFICMMTPPQL